MWTNAGGGRYEGQFKEGLRHGEGTFVCDRYSYRGTWFHGEPTIPPGQLQLKTARNDTDDFEPQDVDFMNPIPPTTLEIRSDPKVEKVPLHHLVFYVKKPTFESPFMDEGLAEEPVTVAPSAPGSPEVETRAGSRAGSPNKDAGNENQAAVDLSEVEDADQEVEAEDTRLRREGIEAGRSVSISLHRRDDSNAVLSPRPMLKPPDEGFSECEQISELVCASDEQGFIMCKGLTVMTTNVQPGQYVLVCTDASPEAVTSVVGEAGQLLIPVDIITTEPRAATPIE